MTDSLKIDALRIHLGHSLKRISEEAGLSTPQTLYDIKKGKHGFSKEVATRLVKAYPELNISWLLADTGPMLLSDIEEPQAGSAANVSAPVSVVPGSERAVPVSQTNRVPLVPISAFAGPISSFTSDGVKGMECETVYSPTIGAELALTVSGDSMEPMLQDGTIIFIKRINDQAFIPWGHTMVLDTENGAFVKDIYPANEPDKVVARSKNAKYPDMIIPRGSIFGIYRVLNAVKSFGLV